MSVGNDWYQRHIVCKRGSGTISVIFGSGRTLDSPAYKTLSRRRYGISAIDRSFNTVFFCKENISLDDDLIFTFVVDLECIKDHRIVSYLITVCYTCIKHSTYLISNIFNCINSSGQIVICSR